MASTLFSTDGILVPGQDISLFILGAVAHGQDPAGEKATERGTLTIRELADRFMSEDVEQKRKPGTSTFYRHLLEKVIKPELGATKADKVTRVTRLHGKLKATPFQANRVLAGRPAAFSPRSCARTRAVSILAGL